MANSLLYQDSVLHSVLHGNLSSVPEPSSRVTKIIIISTKSDFEVERRYLQDRVWPELQRHCASAGIDLEILDVHQGNEVDSTLDPHIFNLQLREIEQCHQESLGCFLLCLVGNKYKPCPLPYYLDMPTYTQIYEKGQEAGLDVSLLDQWYKLNNNLVPPAYTFQSIPNKYRKFALRKPPNISRGEFDSEVQEWIDEEEQILKIIQYGARVAYEEGLINQNNQQKQRMFFLSGVHQQLHHALNISSSANQRVIAVLRQLEDIVLSDPAVPNFLDTAFHESAVADDESSSRLQEFTDEIIFSVHKKNVHFFNIPWYETGIDCSNQEHRFYIEKFGKVIFMNIKALLDEGIASTLPDWQNLPPPMRKPIQEIMRESQSHLTNCRQHLRSLGVSQSLDSDYGPLLQIQQLMLGQEDCMRHSPIIVCGQDGCGKSTLLSQVFMYCPEWLGSDVVRIVRNVGQSPCTTFTPELLRNLCLHICLRFGFEITPQHYSFELGKLSIWFQDLLKLVESEDNDLVIVLDNLHELRSAPNNQAAILGWLPWNLPPNVHIICSIAKEAETVLGLLKSRISTGENFIDIPTLNCQAAVSMLQSNLKDNKHALRPEQWQVVKQRLDGKELCSLYVKLLSHLAKNWTSYTTVCEDDIPQNVENIVNVFLTEIEDRYGADTVRKISTYLTCTSFGLREAEIVELLSSSEYEGPQIENNIDNKRIEFSPTNWFCIKEDMGSLMKVYYVDKRPYLHWSHRTIADAVKKRYLDDPKDCQLCHTDLASAFHLGFLMEKDQKGSLLDESKSKRKDDWSDMLREIDELWYHLMLSGDYMKLKLDAVVNFDFLLAAARGASISYIRSILEIVRCQLLDWEVELLYSMTKQSVDVLSQDPQQLSTEILNWLRPFLDGTSKILEQLVDSAREWCNNNVTPLLVPHNNWLSLSLPPQVTVVTTSHTITHMVSAPDSQHAMCCTPDNTIEMYHLPSKNLVQIFTDELQERLLSFGLVWSCLSFSDIRVYMHERKTLFPLGHKDRIMSLHLTVSGRWMMSGSKDSEIITWEVEDGFIVRRLNFHSSGVQCITTTHSETMTISGSDAGVVIVSRIESGQVVRRLENHRGVVSSVAVNSGDDIFASASTDRCVCIWSLEDFTLLNTIHLTSPITHMDISKDSTFLLLACTDQSVHVRSLITGSDVHCLYGHPSTVTSLCFARDNCRCVIGCKDGKCYVFDIHSARLLQSLSGHHDPVSNVQAQEKDRFLITSGGNKIIVWNFFSKKPQFSASKIRAKKDDKHQEPVTCVAVSRDGSLALSGAKDCTVKVWQLNSGELHATLKGHTGTLTCVVFSPNGLFAVSGSEDTSLKVWGLTLGLIVSTFQEHHCKITAVAVTSDSRRVLSVDTQSSHRLWQADTGTQLAVCTKPSLKVAVHANMVFAVGGKNDCSLKFWPVTDMEAEKSVSHSDAITCYTVTYDCQTIVTGSNDMSLKVWEVGTGKLTQVLVGHEGAVTCAAAAPLSPSLVISGSADCNLILWDLTTGNDNFTLRGHTESVLCVKLTLDGTLAVSASKDNTIQIWNTSNGLRVAMLGVHLAITNMAVALNVSQVVLQLTNNNVVPLLKLHNNPAKGMILDLPPGTPVAEETKTPSHSWRGVVPQRVFMRGNLKREQSFDSFYWDLRSASPKHDLGISLEDFRRIPSPFGSREHLHLAGTVWDGRLGRSSGIHADLQPKAKLPKHKMLKKQQSMFACFPEFMSNQTAPQQLHSPQNIIKDIGLDRKLADFSRPQKLTSQKSLSRAASLEETGGYSESIPENSNCAAVQQSSICVLS